MIVWVATWSNYDTGIWDDKGEIVPRSKLVAVCTSRNLAKWACWERETPAGLPEAYWPDPLEWNDGTLVSEAFIERCCDRGMYTIVRMPLKGKGLRA